MRARSALAGVTSSTRCLPTSSTPVSPSREPDTSTSTFEAGCVDVFLQETLADLARPAWVERVNCPLRWTPAARPPVNDHYALWLDQTGLGLLPPGLREPLRIPVPGIARRSGPDLLLRACTPGRRDG